MSNVALVALGAFILGALGTIHLLDTLWHGGLPPC